MRSHGTGEISNPCPVLGPRRRGESFAHRAPVTTKECRRWSSDRGRAGSLRLWNVRNHLRSYDLHLLRASHSCLDHSPSIVHFGVPAGAYRLELAEITCSPVGIEDQYLAGCRCIR